MTPNVPTRGERDGNAGDYRGPNVTKKNEYDQDDERDGDEERDFDVVD